MTEDITTAPLGTGKDGKPVYLQRHLADQQGDRRHRRAERVARASSSSATARCSRARSSGRRSQVDTGSDTYRWNDGSHLREEPALFRGHHDGAGAGRRHHGRAHPGGARRHHHHRPHQPRRHHPARPRRPANICCEHQVAQTDFNSYGARRGNHEVMMRGTFANIRIRNEMVPGVEGGMTKHYPSGEHDADLRRGDALQGGGRAAGRSSAARNTAPARSRDWAAKGTMLLGVKAVIAESFERIHRSNLVGMGVLPLTFKDGHGPQDARPHRRRDHRRARPGRHHAAHGPARS